MNNNYSVHVCNEVTEILDHIPKELYDKLPNAIINYFYKNADDNIKKFTYNVRLPLSEQEISQTTKDILIFLYRIFWQKDNK